VVFNQGSTDCNGSVIASRGHWPVKHINPTALSKSPSISFALKRSLPLTDANV